jgi:hypothetical protein
MPTDKEKEILENLQEGYVSKVGNYVGFLGQADKDIDENIAEFDRLALEELDVSDKPDKQ